jgi:hypothetical protein
MIRHLSCLVVFTLFAALVGIQSCAISFPVPGRHEFTHRELLVKEIAANVFAAYSLPGGWLPEKSLLALVIDSLFWGGVLFGGFRMAMIAIRTISTGRDSQLNRPDL